MIGLLMNNELENIWKEGFMAQLSYSMSICLEGLEKIMKNLSQVTGLWAEL
jgi:hypothetical protein